MAHNVITMRVFIRKIPTDSVLINIPLLQTITLPVLGELEEINLLSKPSPREVSKRCSLLGRLRL